ncbi:MOSC domain-containing protein [Paenibacillus whitsoniae]|uniref:MOSC domain-containing protein n=1 Tax=Paenibacillus whitsoniae TaxID=2496558 RepID=A0A430JK39_9BACL|nr:MOSC domain-containing protein [Paenibacillus whitsoniae]RTE11343.1 MOSC domain-containing protein [Paenibacillus whitsoniae]
MKYRGEELVTGIVKTPVSSLLHLSKLGLEGDGQADLTVHGGVDKALCVYPEEHYAYWEEKRGQRIEPVTFGENLTVRGMLEQDVCIGDIYAIGDALVQVSQPRQPCHKLAKRMDWPQAALYVQETGYTGYYFRVLQEGKISQTSPIKLVRRDEHGITLKYANHTKYHDKKNLEAARKLAGLEVLSESWKQSFLKRVAELEA